MKTTNEFIAQQCDQAGEIVEFDCAALPGPPAVSFSEFLDSRDFYELMQAYRHTPMDAAKEFEAVKFALRKTIAQPVQPAFEIVGYQFQWTNPADNPDHDGVMTKWVEVVPDWNQTVQQKIDQLLAYRYSGKATYRVRVLYTPTNIAQPATPQPAAGNK